MTLYETPKNSEWIPVWGYFAMHRRMDRIKKTYDTMKIKKPTALIHGNFKLYHYYSWLIILNLLLHFVIFPYVLHI